MFNITNITFLVSISEQNNPSAFPITITYDTLQRKNNQLNYVYQFDVPFSSQKETLVNDIIDFIISSSQRRRKRRQTSDFSKPDPCTLSPERGPCTASITRYYYNVTTQTCQQFLYGGCFPNENNFFTQHNCEDKCSDCYPVCTPEYCAIKRGGTCSVPSSRPGSTQGCPGGCALSNCGACYYSYNDLPLPPLPDSCPSVCPFLNGGVDESCMTRWGRCVQRSYYNIYQTVSGRERFKNNFRCWSHQCTN